MCIRDSLLEGATRGPVRQLPGAQDGCGHLRLRGPGDGGGERRWRSGCWRSQRPLQLGEAT
eukprot:3285015-Alexandrium_andersonii.AAC.1